MWRGGGLTIGRCNLLALGGEELTSDSWPETPTSPGLSNNMFKVEELTIARGGLPRLGGEELSSDGRFEADIVTKW